MKLHELYKAILESAGLTVDSKDWLVSTVFDDKTSQPIEVSQKRLVVPAPALLRKGPEEWQNLIAFHPLSESVLYGESEVQRRFRDIITFRFTSIMLAQIYDIFMVSTQPNLQKKLPPAAIKVLGYLAGADERTVTAIDSILNKVHIKNPAQKLISLYTRKEGGRLDGRTYDRLCNVTSPFLEELNKDDSTVFGVKLRKRPANEKEMLRNLFDYILPLEDDPKAFNSGSSSPVAPNFHVLIQSYIKVAKALNRVTDDFRAVLTDADGLYINLDWAPHVEDLEDYDGVIPPMDGNIGRGGKGNSADATMTNKRPSLRAEDLVVDNTNRPAARVVPATQYVEQVQQPQYQEQPQPVQESAVDRNGEKKISLKDLGLNGGQGNVYGPAVIYNGHQAGPAYTAPVQPYYPQVQTQPVYAPAYSAPVQKKISAKDAYGGSFSVGNTSNATAIDTRYLNQPPQQQYVQHPPAYAAPQYRNPQQYSPQPQYQAPYQAPQQQQPPMVQDPATGFWYYHVVDAYGNVTYPPVPPHLVPQAAPAHPYGVPNQQYNNYGHPNYNPGYPNQPVINERQRAGGYRS